VHAAQSIREISLNRNRPAGTNAQAPNYRRQQGAFAVPVLRYFVVMGCCLLGLLFAVDYLAPKETAAAPAETATVSNGGSLASWRQSQQNLTKSQVAAVVYPDITPMAPTAERLQFERQMTYRRADAVPQEPKSSPVYEAKAEMVDVGAVAVAVPKPVAKIARHKTVVHRDRPPNNYAAAYPPAPVSQFGGYRQAQFDRPGNNWFTGFKMF
jgi:hypothetical protein